MIIERNLHKLSDVAMIIMVKSEHGDDPFKADGPKHCKTVVQLAAHARNLMLAHGLTCAFVLGIYGDLLDLDFFAGGFDIASNFLSSLLQPIYVFL